MSGAIKNEVAPPEGLDLRSGPGPLLPVLGVPLAACGGFHAVSLWVGIALGTIFATLGTLVLVSLGYLDQETLSLPDTDSLEHWCEWAAMGFHKVGSRNIWCRCEDCGLGGCGPGAFQ